MLELLRGGSVATNTNLDTDIVLQGRYFADNCENGQSENL